MCIRDRNFKWLRNLAIAAFVLFVGGNLVYELSKNFNGKTERFAHTDEYKGLWKTMETESKPILDSLKRMTEIEGEMNKIRTDIFENGDEELQYQVGRFTGNYNSIVAPIPDAINKWKTHRTSFKNHREMSMEEIKSDFEKMSSLSADASAKLNECLKKLNLMVVELRGLKK